MDVNGLLVTTGAAVTVLGGIGVGTRYIVRSMTALGDRWENIQRDLYGEPARLGVPEVPGAVARLGKAEAAIAAHDVRHNTTDARLSALEQRVAAREWQALGPDPTV